VPGHADGMVIDVDYVPCEVLLIDGSVVWYTTEWICAPRLWGAYSIYKVPRVVLILGITNAK
jgi:hypothetical protein